MMRFLLRSMIQTLKKIDQIRKSAWRSLSEQPGLKELGFFLSFLLHRYDIRQFQPLNMKDNLTILEQLEPTLVLSANRKGRLFIHRELWRQWIFSIGNILLLGALQKRVERVVYYTYLTVTLELNNPVSKAILIKFLRKKIDFLKRHLQYAALINGKSWDQSAIYLHIDLFHRNSLLQAKVIGTMRQVIHRQKEPGILREAKESFEKGLYPLLVMQGLSGSYWIRGKNRQLLGLFKPFDEEIHAPNNPMGPSYQGVLGMRTMRLGCLVGQSPLHEVGAFIVDEFLGFGIVPKTYFAEFSHVAFFSAREDRFSSLKVKKTKRGSFQEFVDGFLPATHLNRKDLAAIPLDEFQLLVLLDVIIGNQDRNIGNILLSHDKIAAVDHGLSFPDQGDEFSFWYWKWFEQGKQLLLPSIVDLLHAFPFEPLFHRLKARCSISLIALQRIRERVTLFSEAIGAGLVPAELEDLFKNAYLDPLKDRVSTLQATAHDQVKRYLEDHTQEN